MPYQGTACKEKQMFCIELARINAKKEIRANWREFDAINF